MAARAFICQQQPEGTEGPLHLLQDKDQAPFLALEALTRLLPGSLSPPPSSLQTYLPALTQARPSLALEPLHWLFLLPSPWHYCRARGREEDAESIRSVFLEPSGLPLAHTCTWDSYLSPLAPGPSLAPAQSLHTVQKAQGGCPFNLLYQKCSLKTLLIFATEVFCRDQDWEEKPT